MYELGDVTALQGPKVMNQATMNATVRRIVSHAETRKLDLVSVALHGGEPLMIGLTRLESFARSLQDALGTRLSLSIQTNGLLLDQRWIELFLKYDILVGLSLDGPESAHNEWRVDHQGRGTYKKVLASLRMLQSASKTEDLRFGGVISVINPRQNSESFYKWIKKEAILSINLLFPDANHDNYSNYYPYSIKEFSSFLIPLFDLWWGDEIGERPSIRFFESVLKRAFGQPSTSESIGYGEAPAIIIETNGSIQAHDVLRTTLLNHSYAGNVLTHEISTIDDDVLYRSVNPSLFSLAYNSLPSVCKNCPAADICRGGFVAHRFSAENIFDNPSIYCDALFSTITHIYLRAAAGTEISEVI